MPEKFIESVKEAIENAVQNYNKDYFSSPVALLWTDPKREWEPVVEKLVNEYHMPIATLGRYEPDIYRGPAIFIRCLISQALKDADFPNVGTPVIYLPGHSKDDLRNPQKCPKRLIPLFELQYRGIIWSQRNGKDWTIPAFLKNILSIDIAMDRETRDAAANAVGALCDEPLSLIKNKQPLTASYFNSLVNPDVTRQLLLWINAPKEEKDSMGAAQWRPFCSQCTSEYEFNPETDTPVTAAQKLGAQENNWSVVWDRYCENPAAYPNIPIILRSIEMPGLVFYQESWPQINENMEEKLKHELLLISEKSRSEAIETILALEEKHKTRRGWIWTTLGESPFASALEYLAILAKITKENRFAGNLSEQTQRYINDYWKADNAVIKAVASADSNKECREIIANAISAISKPWFSALATEFQNEWIREPPNEPEKGYAAETGTAYLFVDGLRFDLAYNLKEMVDKKGQKSTIGFRYAALPSLTPTAKPGVMPIAGELSAGPEFTPLTNTGASANITALRRLMEEDGIQILDDSNTGDVDGTAWTDCGNIDREGHDKQIELPLIITKELQRIEDRINELLNAGWQKVRVVTDHGWLFVPGGMDKTDLLPALTEVKKSRCARLLPDKKTNLPTVAWHWDRNVTVALAPGITCFDSGKIYEHGGLSPQEVITPEIIIENGNKAISGKIMIHELKWMGLRLKGEIEGADDFSVDIRTQPGDQETSLLNSPQQISGGKLSVVVPDDSTEGDEAFLVIIDPDNVVCFQLKIIIGGE